jgi:hypothetical protein
VNIRADGCANPVWTPDVTPSPARSVRTDSPWAFPWEKRQHERTSVDLRARLQGPRGEVEVRALNVSAGGTLLELCEQDLCSVPPLVERSVLHSVARSLFGAHLGVAFLERGVTVGARLARLVCPPDATERLQLGLRFLEILNPLQLTRLGAPVLASTAGAVPVGTASMAADPETRISATIRAEGDPEEEPLATGPLLGIADHAVAFRDREGDAGETVARLAGRPLSLLVHQGSHVLWTTSAHLISVRVLGTQTELESLGGVVETTVLTESDPTPALAPHLRPTGALAPA